MAKAKAYNPIRTGADPRNERSNGEGGLRHDWLKIAPNESFDVTILVDADDIIACEQCAIWLKGDREEGVSSPVWTYTGPEDPMHDLEGVTKSYRAFLPIVHDGEIKVWPMGKMAHSQILDISDAAGNIAGMVVRIKRTGAGLNTRYSVTPTGKRKDVSGYDEVDVIAQLGAITPDAARELIVKKLNMASYEDVLDAYRGKGHRPTGVPKGKRAGTPVAPAPEDDDLILEDDDEDEDDE